RETEKLMQYIRKVTSEGRSAFYISHRLDEVRELSQRITVLRDGVNVGGIPPREATRDRMVSMMAGRPPKAAQQPVRQLDDAETVLEVRNLGRENEFRDISFTLRKGEILGVSGLIGSGR